MRLCANCGSSDLNTGYRCNRCGAGNLPTRSRTVYSVGEAIEYRRTHPTREEER